MKKSYIGYIMLFLIVFSSKADAQNNFFTSQSVSSFITPTQKRVIIPEKCKAFSLNYNAMHNFLFALPKQNDVINREETPIIEIPMPNGSISKFHVWERSIMEPGLEAQFPEIKTFLGQGITDKTAVITMDISPEGFHAMIISSVTGNVFIDPFDLETKTNYISYYRKDLKQKFPFKEDRIEESMGLGAGTLERFPTSQCRASQLRTYRLAVSCTGEYARAATGRSSPTVAQTMAKIVITVNRVNSVYELEVGIHFNLIATNSSIVYTNPNSDPYTGNDDGFTLIGESQTNITSVITSANFDIGHTFSTGGGGVATPGVCDNALKARGVTGSPQPTGDPYDIDFVAHEIGHQFNGQHTFNAATGNCLNNGVRTPASAAANAEPGSGTTIMAYAGICGINDLQPHSDPQFHAGSLAEILKFSVTGVASTCAVLTNTTNVAPVVIAGSDYTIPVNTPFTLSGTATDANGDALTYSWEQMDVAGAFGNWNALPQTANIPLFRSFAPKNNGVRSFPQVDDIISASTTIGERLPTIARTMKFRLTARDNKAGCGGVCFDDVVITVSTSGASGTESQFLVTYPNDGSEIWFEGETKTVTWNKGSTNLAPYNAANVAIELSIDGGYTFPITLLASTPNDGTQTVVVTNNFTTQAKIRIRAINSVFYDMSNNDFVIMANPVPVKWLSLVGEKEKNSSVKLSWSVNEIDNHFYTIERSLDGEKFSKIGNVNSILTAQNIHNYSFIDAAPFATKNYYRIKQTDKNGSFSYSKTVSVTIDKAVSSWVVFPNPTIDKVNLFCNANYSNIKIELYDAVGKLVFIQANDNANKGDVISLSVGKLSKGVYSIKLKANNTESFSQKIIVQ